MTQQMNLAVIPQDFLLKIESDINELKDSCERKMRKRLIPNGLNLRKFPKYLVLVGKLGRPTVIKGLFLSARSDLRYM